MSAVNNLECFIFGFSAVLDSRVGALGIRILLVMETVANQGAGLALSGDRTRFVSRAFWRECRFGTCDVSKLLPSDGKYGNDGKYCGTGDYE